MSLTSSNKSIARRTDTGHGVAFTTVRGGNMSFTVLAPGQTVHDTAKNRRAFESESGIPPGTTSFVSQTHSTIVLQPGASGWAEQDTVGEGDALISPDGTDPIAILVADCLPVAFTTEFGPTAIAHAGRVGLLNGILQNTVAQLRTYGAGRITAVIGPGICGDCYEVPLSMQQEAVRDHPRIAAKTSWGTPSLDLPAAATDILENLDVDVHNVAECTFTNDQLYSHRRAPGTGRLAGFVWKLQESV